MNRHVSGICCLIVVCGFGRLEAQGAEQSKTIRLRAVADVWVSDANDKERNTNSGKHSRLKLKTIQEMSLVDSSAASTLRVGADGTWSWVSTETKTGKLDAK